MKKLIMTMMAAVLMSATAFAQDEKQCNCNCKCKDKKPDKTEMVKHRTDKMVKRYQLNDKQAKQLFDLNTKFADKMRPMGGPHHHGPKGGPGRPPQAGPDGKGDRPAPPKDGQRPEPPKDGKHMGHHKDGDHKAHRQQMEETMKAYNAELEKIMTPDQFKAYQADMQKRHEHKGHHGHKGGHKGHRGHGNHEAPGNQAEQNK